MLLYRSFSVFLYTLGNFMPFRVTAIRVSMKIMKLHFSECCFVLENHYAKTILFLWLFKPLFSWKSWSSGWTNSSHNRSLLLCLVRLQCNSCDWEARPARVLQQQEQVKNSGSVHGLSKFYDWHLSTQPNGVSLCNRMSPKSGRWRLCNYESPRFSRAMGPRSRSKMILLVLLLRSCFRQCVIFQLIFWKFMQQCLISSQYIYEIHFLVQDDLQLQNHSISHDWYAL